MDERAQGGAPIFMDISGEAHADEFWKLAQEKEQGPWLYTFVKGQGYVKFEP